MEKVVLKVNVKATESGCIFKNSNTGEILGSVIGSSTYKGRHYGVFSAGNIDKFSDSCLTYTDALEWVSDKIERILALVGIDVEFVNVEGEK